MLCFFCSSGGGAAVAAAAGAPGFLLLLWTELLRAQCWPKEAVADFDKEEPLLLAPRLAAPCYKKEEGRRRARDYERTDGRTDAALYYTCNTRSTTMATG